MSDEQRELGSCGAKFLAIRPRNAPLSFALIIFSPDQTVPKQFKDQPEINKFQTTINT